MEEKSKTKETTVCPHCEGFGYLESDTVPGGPCNVCCGSGWLTKSQLDEWEMDNTSLDGFDVGW